MLFIPESLKFLHIILKLKGKRKKGEKREGKMEKVCSYFFDK